MDVSSDLERDAEPREQSECRPLQQREREIEDRRDLLNRDRRLELIYADPTLSGL